jgi:four helix bundle protein
MVCRAARRFGSDAISDHIKLQLVRSATAPAANYAEARSAESQRDFVHKLQICIKELREASIWIRILTELEGKEVPAGGQPAQECSELISIFVASVATSKRKNRTRPLQCRHPNR